MVVGLHLLENSTRDYAWGSHTAIAELLGLPSPTEQPQAELWIGAHPAAPSRLIVEGRRERLDELISRHPEELLGARVASRFGSRLPFLLKVLAADEPLSLQAHPTRAQAEQGYARENAAAIPLDAPNRSYRDDNHKPELFAPLAETWALYGFRDVSDAIGLLGRLGEPLLEPLLGDLAEGGHRRFFSSLLGLAPDERSSLVGRALAVVPGRIGGPEAEWVAKLSARYGREPGVLAPLFLNLVCIRPGQAIYIEAGELHAYLRGVGVELMASSDNVLRGGLTPKYVDVPALTSTLTFRGARREPLLPSRLAGAEELFETPAAEFRLSRIRLSPQTVFRCDQSAAERSVEILLLTEGTAEVTARNASTPLRLRRGSSCLVAAAAGAYRVGGSGLLFRAAVP